MAIFLFLTLVASMGQFVAAPLAPFLINDLGLSKTQLGLLTSAVFWGSFACGMLSGYASDKLGEKKMALVGTFIISAALLSFSLSSTFIFLLVSSFFIGSGYSAITALTNRGLALWFSDDEKAFAIGMKQSGMPLGTAIGASVMPVLALSYSWPHAVKLLCFLVLLSGITCYLLYREPAQKQSTPPQGAHSRHAHSQSSGENSQGKIIHQTPTSCCDCRQKEKKMKNISYTSLLSNRKILLTGVMGIGFVMTQLVIMTFTIPYLQEALSLPVITAGHYLALFQTSGVISRPVFGYIGDHAFCGRRHYTLFTLALFTSGLTLVLSLISSSFPWWFITIIVFATGFTALGWFGPYFALLTEIAGIKAAGMAIGLGITFNCLGISLGNPLFGYIVDTTGSYSLA